MAREPRHLPFVGKAQAMETRSPYISGIHLDGSWLLQVSEFEKVALVTRVDLKKTTREERFGKLRETIRKELKDLTQFEEGWRGVFRKDDFYIYLDGARARLLAYKVTDFSLIAERSFAWDMLRPPPDSRGAPTSVEVARLRKIYQERFEKAPRVKYTGIQPIPKGWVKAKGDLYFLSGQVEGFPLSVLECDPEEPTRCEVIQACYISGLPSNPYPEITGVAILPSKRWILLGDRKDHRILVFKYSSCFDSQYVSSIYLPKKMKKLSNIHIDEEGRLWVSSDWRDDYHNASIYFYDQDEWTKIATEVD